MPFHLPFGFPPFYNRFRNPYHTNIRNYNEQEYNNTIHTNNNNNNYNNNNNNNKINNNYLSSKKEDPINNESSESFFEIFGLKLYFDDMIIICLLFILYTEKLQDDELFICLILLLLS